MKKLLFVLFIAGNIFTYSNSKCEATAKRGVDALVRSLAENGQKVEYTYLGVNQFDPNIYSYEIVSTDNGKKNYATVVINVLKGNMNIAEGLSGAGPVQGQSINIKAVATDLDDLKCK